MGRRRQAFHKRPRLLDWKEIQTWDKHLPFSCDACFGVDCVLFLSTLSLTSCQAEMPTEPILLLSQLCPYCGQWSAAVRLLCHQHNQNCLKPVSSVSQKLCFSPTFRAPLLLPPPNIPTSLNEKRRTQKERESEDDNIQYKMLSPIQFQWKAPFLSVHTEADTIDNMFMCQTGFPAHLCCIWFFEQGCHTHTNKLDEFLHAYPNVICTCPYSVCSRRRITGSS